ncbi:MAG: transcriptional regulator [Candidatus Omnitrophica bacterium CG08_land_8_20_14_0_20_41_16]|uniref:Transcriptional regulator n=1 Tax=Candidatus Sherwoodlollariibacterium unditelluris TaxID=1974757 RepID=A0A2G9YJX5_9BACT|nr:MAG: transcriptional regulator [Candidatus Omnitrophica bacterium CG23_combo_of_CG06-09_8_20_14_all_41_10]PIS34503.1 MAG: transcriptional regulator [Candidatus Omnitrophica bacterium CG08_land_8_20_14_0_20_41_16]
MKKYKIFISGVQKELKEERRAAKEFILNDALFSDYFDVFLFEDAPAKSRPVESIYLGEVKKSDIYIGIIGQQYGVVGKNMMSPTEKEFREAKKLHKTILVYIKGENGKNDKKRDDGVQRLIKEMGHPQDGYARKRFKDISELTRLVYASLIEFLKEEGIVGRGAFDERICADARIADIDEEKVSWFLRVAREERKFTLSPEASVNDVLVHLNLLRDGKLTNAAVLLFGKNPHRFFLQAEVKCVQLPGTEVCKPFPSYKVYSGNLFEQVDKAVGFVLDIIKQAVIQQKHTPQFKRPFEIPVFAIQEAIVNAVAHRNYNVTSGVQVMVFTDRIEVWNSGSLPPELNIEDLRKPHTSFPANPLLANVLYFANYIQRTGSGTLEMIKQCRAQGAPEPEFVLIRNVEFRMILPRDVFTEEALNKIGLNERQIEAVKFIKVGGRITNKEYQKTFGLKKRQSTDDLKELETKGILSRVGTTGRGTYYILKGAPKGRKGH